MQKLGVIGQGFVGSAVANGMSHCYEMITYDKDPNKTCTEKSLYEVIEKTDIVFLCVPTPMYKSGGCDLTIVDRAMKEIVAACDALNKHVTVILKSTVPPGTTAALNDIFSHRVNVVFNPEFLTEANANDDYKNQNRIIVGGDRPYTSQVKQIFAKAFPKVPIIKTSSTIAEMVKYVTNTFLAMKVSFANEMYQISQALDIDYDKVIEYARYDERLGQSHWSVPGPDGDKGFGGHCFPKDVAALTYLAVTLGVEPTMLAGTAIKNKEVRTDRDWEKQIGRAVSEE
jgi:nucleotide sugar dehydrogenase